MHFHSLFFTQLRKLEVVECQEQSWFQMRIHFERILPSLVVLSNSNHIGKNTFLVPCHRCKNMWIHTITDPHVLHFSICHYFFLILSKHNERNCLQLSRMLRIVADRSISTLLLDSDLNDNLSHLKLETSCGSLKFNGLSLFSLFL
jgi:hypothetical protein